MAPSSLLAASLLALSMAAFQRAPIFSRDGQPESVFDKIEASADFEWTYCYQKPFQCAKLTVPLDYTDTSVGTVDVAFVRYLVSEQPEDLLLSPGSPGGSGIEFIAGSAETFGKNWPGYDFVSFDPRAVGKSGPRLGGGSSNTHIKRANGVVLGNLTEAWDMNNKR